MLFFNNPDSAGLKALSGFIVLPLLQTKKTCDSLTAAGFFY
jgi:hypothetical protein